MSALGSHTVQGFGFRSKSNPKSFCDLTAGVTAEKLCHVELVSNGLAMLNNGPDQPATKEGDGAIFSCPFQAMQKIRSAAAFFIHGGAVPMNSSSMSCSVDTVTTAGSVVFGLLHNLPLECGGACTSCGFMRRCRSAALMATRLDLASAGFDVDASNPYRALAETLERSCQGVSQQDVSIKHSGVADSADRARKSAG